MNNIHAFNYFTYYHPRIDESKQTSHLFTDLFINILQTYVTFILLEERRRRMEKRNSQATSKSRSSNHELPLCARIIQEYLRIWTNLNGNRIPCYYDLLRLPRVWSGVQGKQENKAQIWAYRAIGFNSARSLCRDNNSAILSWNSIRYITG